MNSARDDPFRFFAPIIMFIFDHLSKHTPIQSEFFRIEKSIQTKIRKMRVEPSFSKKDESKKPTPWKMKGWNLQPSPI